jgi:NhaP-type Na+/H+ or K+/H+ antiporter
MWYEFLLDIFTHAPSALYLNMALLGGFIVFFGLVSLFVKERLYLTEALCATVFGIVFGPVGFGVVDIEKWMPGSFYSFIFEFSRYDACVCVLCVCISYASVRLVIALQVMSVGVSTPGGYVVKNWRSIAIFLGPVTCVMYVVSSACVKAVLNLPWTECMIIGACVTPTDPVLANSVIKGKFANRYIPTHLRNLLAIESGANDGLALPFLMLPVLLMFSASKGAALGEWAVHTWIYEIFFAILVGAACGTLARWLLRQSEKRNLVDKESFLVFTIALTLLVTGISAMLHCDDLLSVFVCGNAFAWDEKFLLASHDSDIAEVIDLLFNITYFVIYGSIIPWRAFAAFGVGRLILMASLILLFRRLPVVMLLRQWAPALQSRKQAFFAGWFGPMGVGAIFFALYARFYFIEHAREGVSTEIVEIVFPVVAFVVLSSILIHGITVPITNFHMKKRAKLKNKRTQKIREQLAAIAGESIAVVDVEKETKRLTQVKVEPDFVAQQPILAAPDEGADEWEYYTDYEDDDLPVVMVEEASESAGIPEPITVIIDGAESHQETLRPGVRRKVRRRRPVGSPCQSTVTSLSEALLPDSDNTDTVMSADFPAGSSFSPHHFEDNI